MRAKGMVPSKAAVAAGYATGSAIYTELESSPEMVVRIQELLDEFEERRERRREAAKEASKVVGQTVGLGKAWVLQRLAENAALAAESGDFKESNAALKLIGDEFGMFSGGSGLNDEGDGSVPAFDFDRLAEVLSKNPALEAPDEDDALEGPEDNEALAMSLIEGQSKSAARLARDRQLTVGSETDVALTPDAEPAEDDFLDMVERLNQYDNPDEEENEDE